jgi:hypothetical protein
MAKRHTTNLTDALNAIKQSTNNHEITFDDIVKALNHRGFGTLLIAPSLITILPTGAIPGVPAICSLFIILIAFQIVIDRPYPWLPKRIRNISFSRQKYIEAVEKSAPYITKIDSFFHPRLEFLTGHVIQRIIALVCVFLALAIIIMGFVPFAALLPAIPILIFGLALSIHDGLLMLIGIVYTILAFTIVPILLY